MQASLDNPDFLNNGEQRAKFISAIRQDELQTLQQLYEPKQRPKITQGTQARDCRLKGFVEELEARRAAFQDTGQAVHSSALQEVEQEREVAFEVEAVRQLKKPINYPALSFRGLSEELKKFVETGRLPAAPSSVMGMLDAISKTHLGAKFQVIQPGRPSKLFVSMEYNRTVQGQASLAIDNFLVRILPFRW